MDNLNFTEKIIIISALKERIHSAKEQIKWNNENVKDENIRNANNLHHKQDVEEIETIIKKIRRL